MTASHLSLQLKHGKNFYDLTMEELANYKFTDVVLEDGTQFKDITFAQLVKIVWTNVNKS